MAKHSDNLPIESNDDAVLRMLSGAAFENGASIILPSGKALNGDEASAFSAAFETEIKPTKLDDPLPPANDNWTDDPTTNRVLLAQRARDAARRGTPIRPYDAPPRRQRGEWIARLRDWLSR